MGKLIYNEVMNRWMNNYSLDEYNESAVFREGYDDPTYMTFRIEFGDWGASVLDRSEILQGTTQFFAAKNNYDALPIGLLNCPYPGIKDGDSYWQNNANSDSTEFNSIKDYSAFRYLRQRNEDTRAKYLYYFVNGLFEIQKKTPYIFKKINGLSTLEKFDPTKGQRIDKEAKITVECFEGLNLKIRTLMEFYRKAAWDDVYQRWILPENLRQFKMIIYVFERRLFQDMGTFSDLDSKHTIMKYNTLNADIPVKAYECCPCEFSIPDSMSWNDSYSGNTENAEETSKLVINVKNVKTYYKNNLLNSTLSNNYNSNASPSKASLDQKISDLMIYDLVETVERSNSEDLNVSSATQSYTGALTVNGMRSLFLNKNILLQNEDANENVKHYIWGKSVGGTFSYQQYINDDTTISEIKCTAEDWLYGYGMNYDYTTYHDRGITSAAIDDPLMDILNIYEPYPRAGWISVLVNSPEYDSNQSFWSNVGNMAYEIMHGARRQILLSGCNFSLSLTSWTNMMNCLYCDMQYVSYAIDAPGSITQQIFDKRTGNNRKSVQQPSLGNVSFVHGQFEELDPLRTIDDKPFELLEDPRQNPSQNYVELEPLRDNPSQNYVELDPLRENPDQDFNEMDPLREIPDQQYNDMDPLRDVPYRPYDYLDDPRTPIQQNMSEMDPLRKIPEQDMSEMEPLREIPDYELSEMDKLRDIPEYEMNEMDSLRDIPDQSMPNMDNVRTIPEYDMPVMIDGNKRKEQKYAKMSDLRKQPDQKYVKLDNIRDASFNITKDLLMEIRELPGFDSMSLEDLRKIPEQELKNLKDTVDNVKPTVKIDSLKAIDTLSKATENKNIVIANLDKENLAEEKAILDTLKLQMASFEMIETEKDPDKESRRKKSIANFAKVLADNSDSIKEAIANNIIRLKQNLMSLSEDSLRHLPNVEIYKMNNKKEPSTNSDNISMASLNDIKQINKNIKILSLSNDEIKQLSLQTLINLNKEMEDRVKQTYEMNGLSKIIDDSEKNNEREKRMKMAKMSENDQKKKGRTMLGLLPPREITRTQIMM